MNALVIVLCLLLSAHFFSAGFSHASRGKNAITSIIQEAGSNSDFAVTSTGKFDNPGVEQAILEKFTFVTAVVETYKPVFSSHNSKFFHTLFRHITPANAP